MVILGSTAFFSVAFSLMWKAGGPVPISVEKQEVILNTKGVFVAGRDLRDAMSVYVDCQERVQQMLKAPATARFAPYGERKVRLDVYGDAHIILSYVDAQNSFGALNRTRFDCRAIKEPGGKWVLADVAFEK